MQINQVISTIAYGDAVSNDTVAFRRVLKSMGYNSKIYAESIVYPINNKTALPIEQLKNVSKDDILIYHASTGTQLNFDFANYPCRKIMVYHNITPPEFFTENDEYIKGINQWGLEGIKYLHDKVDYCLAVSEFNKQDLLRMGYTCPIDVLPIIIPMKDYDKKPDKLVLKSYSTGYTNIVFTGRLAPNKKQEDVIAAFYYYRKLYNKKSRLFLVGNYKETDVYYQRLVLYIKRLGIEKDVFITGHIKFNQILAYYSMADVFVCMSEHEGFCVPLVEAMHFKKPVIAYDSSAIASTLGGSGMLLKDKNPVFVAGCIDRIVRDKELRDNIIMGQNDRLKDFKYEVIADQLVKYLKAFI